MLGSSLLLFSDYLGCHILQDQCDGTFHVNIRIDFLTQQTPKTFQIQAPALLFHCNSSIIQSLGQFKSSQSILPILKGQLWPQGYRNVL